MLGKSTDDGAQCFTYTQSDMQLHPTIAVPVGNTLAGLEHKAGENLVLSYYIQTLRKKPSSHGVFLFNKQRVNSSTPLNLRPESFQAYKPPNTNTSPAPEDTGTLTCPSKPQQVLAIFGGGSSLSLAFCASVRHCVKKLQ